VPSSKPSLTQIAAAPKVLLHDHLDGGLRPETVVELASEFGYRGLPTTDPVELGRYFVSEAPRRDLVRYLESFTHTVGVMQHKDALERVAFECVLDLADDGVVYAEVRFAPELHTEAGLELDEVVESVLSGFNAGMAAVGAAGKPIVVRALLSAMRTAARSLEIAELAVRYRDVGVCGFDVAGAEAGYPPTRHLDAFQFVQLENFHATLHAGEAFGLPSIWEALQYCNAERLGHGVRIVDDISVEPDGSTRLGRLASFVRDTRVPLELCPTSNVHTGVVASIAEHPIGLLFRLRFRVTVNTDNRLMSGVTLSSEFAKLAETFDWGWSDISWLTINAIKSAFYPFDERLALIDRVIKPGFAALSDAPVRTEEG
jgi:adenosine deaminase